MKLLFDHNISQHLVTHLAEIYPGSSHVREHGLHMASDEVVWNFARQNGYAIVSKDNDFHQRSFLYGHPPKVVWLRIGNASTDDVRALLKNRAEEMRRFFEDQESSFFALSP